MKPALMTRAAAEVVGTFGFFFLGFMGIAVSVEFPTAIGPAGVAAGFGLGLALMIFALGHISGGHFNPAVSLGLAVGQRFPWVEVPVYWVAQVIGGLAAAGLVRGLFDAKVGDALVNAPGKGVSDGVALTLELVATALFLLVIQAVATDREAPWNGVFAPAAIGTFIFAAALVIGPISGGSFNPARSLAPAIVAQDYTNLWIYLVGPLVGGMVGGVVYFAFRRSEDVPVVVDDAGATRREPASA
jgi:aquaporin NIP